MPTAAQIGLGEAYMAGDWDAPDLPAVLEAMARQVDTIVPPRAQWLRGLYERRHPADEDNDRHGARLNVARHHDLSNELFAAFLDPSMTYSSGLFTRANESLEEAQSRKIERLLDALGVSSGTRVLEIGTGWGELALRAARRGARVTGLTLSLAQGDLVRRRVEAEGLCGAVDIRVEDYRDVRGLFDVVVSVEMIEAVGDRWWRTYFRTLEDRLAPGGRIGLQAIVMAHHRLLATRRSWAWIHKYIFPGGLIPSEQAIHDTLSGHTSLRVVDRLAFGDSYARTLRLWREGFAAEAELVDELGFDRTFRRMWDFYLAYSEAGFRSGYLDVVQLVLSRHESPAGLGAGRSGAHEAPAGGQGPSGLPISQRWPNGSSIRPSSQPCSSATGETGAAPAASARWTTEWGSSTIRSIRAVPPAKVSGLKLPFGGDSSSTQKDASPTESWATTSSWSSVPPKRYFSTAPNADL